MMLARARVGLMMAVACSCFGCGGDGLRLAGALVVTAAELAVVAATKSPPPPSASPPSPPPAPAYYPCVEVPPAPELPGDRYAVRTVACGGYLLVLDLQTGQWREHR